MANSSINFTGSTTGHSGNYYLQITTLRPNKGYTGFDTEGRVMISDGLQQKAGNLVQYALPVMKNFGLNPQYVPQLGGELTYTLLSHYPVRFENVPSYITIKIGGTTVSPNTKYTPSVPSVIRSNSDGLTVQFIFAKNTTGQDRTTDNTFCMKHYTGSTLLNTDVIYFNTRQIGEVTETIDVTPPSVYIPASGGSKQFYVATSAAWHINGTIPSWLTISPTAATGNAVVTVSAPATTSGRSVTLFAATSNSDKSVSIVQPVGEELKLTFLDRGTIGWFTNSTAFTTTIQYSKNNGAWTDLTASVNGSMINVSAGDEVRFRGDNAAYATHQYHNQFGGTASFNISGWFTSLLNKEDYRSVSSLQAPYTFAYLFEGSEAVDASGSYLVVKNLTPYCYTHMFEDCPGLTRGPRMDWGMEEMKLDEGCMESMFQDCTSLSIAPILEAPTLVQGCYRDMFNGCSDLAFINCAATNPGQDITATSNWVAYVADQGRFVRVSGVNWPSGVNGIPQGWQYD